MTAAARGRAVRLLHTSDVHLGPSDPDAADVLARVVDLALAESVDLVLVAGDLFDNPRVPDETVELAAAELQRLTMPVVVLPGNHDHSSDGSAYRRVDFGPVRVILTNEGETLSFPELDLAVWGRAHDGHSPKAGPLESPPPRGPERWQLVIAHGHYVPPGESSERHAPIHAEEIEASGRDYVALGHWDRYVAYRHGSVTACYSGAPGAPFAGAQELSGVVALVTLDPERGTEVRPLPVG
jgi:DNA repair exonuclease SbcCD nuclease subunit